MSLAPGTSLGPYEIQSVLGKGGMGEVYRARDTRLQRDVAIKVLPQTSIDSYTSIKRFQREATALAALSHPNILTIFDVGTEQGISYVVTELLKGEVLRRVIPKDGFSWEKTLSIAIPIAEGLKAAHSQGILHRDLKPENIFITSDDHVKILDFGLARYDPVISGKNASQAQTASRLTESNITIGTVPYMSPEQIRGVSVDARTDIFSFGSVLYEMLTGRRAFAGETSADIVAAILKQQPESPSQTRKDIPEALNAILFRCLEKNPDQRFQTVSDLTSHLKTASSLPLRTQKPALRNQGLVPKIIIPITLLVILLAFVFVYSRFNARKSIESVAVLPFVNASSNPEVEFLSDGITERIINTLSQLPQLKKVMARSTVFSYKGKQIDPRKVGNELRVDAVLMATMIQHGDNIIIHAELVNTEDGSQIWGEEFNRPMADILLVQQEMAKEISQSMQLKLTPEQTTELSKRPTNNIEAYQLYLKGRYYWNKRTHEGFQKAKDYFQQALDKDPTYALAYSGLADYYAQPGYNRLPVQETIPKAFSTARKALELDPNLAEPHVVLGLLSWQRKSDVVQSEKEFRKAIELNPNYPTAHQFYSVALISWGRSQEALTEIKRAAELDPLSLSIQTSWGDIYRESRQYQKALDQYKKVIEMDPNFGQVYMNRGILYEYRGMQDEAVKEGIVGMRLGKNPYLAEIEAIYAKSGWRGLWQDGLNFQLNALKKNEPVDPRYMVRLYLNLGDLEKAMEWTKKYFDENKHDRTVRYDLQFCPMFDPIRSDARFVALLQQFNSKLQ
ncbi:MAG TPA: protein kinase [Acidobacteriota bacterium]|nr:protein kinase [Acidobacteriota bacterium]